MVVAFLQKLAAERLLSNKRPAFLASVSLPSKFLSRSTSGTGHSVSGPFNLETAFPTFLREDEGQIESVRAVSIYSSSSKPFSTSSWQSKQ